MSNQSFGVDGHPRAGGDPVFHALDSRLCVSDKPPVLIFDRAIVKMSPNAVFANSLRPRHTPASLGFRHDLPTARKVPDCQAGRSTIPGERNYGQTRPFGRLTDSQDSFYKDELGRGHNCFVGLDFIDQVSKNVFAPWWQT